MYVGDVLKASEQKQHNILLSDISATDQAHVLIEADASHGVLAVPLSKYRDYNIIGLD